jgi:hypothetical protein
MKKFSIFGLIALFALVACDKKSEVLENTEPKQNVPSVSFIEKPYTYLQNKYIDIVLDYELAKQNKTYDATALSYDEKFEIIALLDSTAKEVTEDTEFYTNLEKQLIAEINSHFYIQEFYNKVAIKEVSDISDILIIVGNDCSDVISKFQILQYYENGFDIIAHYLERGELTGEEEWGLFPMEVENPKLKAVRYTLHSRWGSKIEYLWLNATSTTKTNSIKAMQEWRSAANNKISFSEITTKISWNRMCWVMGWKYFLRIRTVYEGNFDGRSTLGNVPWANIDFKNHASYPRTYLHEFGHTLGLYHEHQRRDRDDYIIYYPDSVQSGEKIWFSKMTAGSYNYYDSDLDFNSIMLYSSKAFGKEIIEDQKEHLKHELSGIYKNCCHTAITMTKTDGISTWSSPYSISNTDKAVIQKIYNY